MPVFVHLFITIIIMVLSLTAAGSEVNSTDLIRCELCEGEVYVARKDKKQHDTQYVHKHLQHIYTEIKKMQGEYDAELAIADGVPKEYKRQDQDKRHHYTAIECAHEQFHSEIKKMEDNLQGNIKSTEHVADQINLMGKTNSYKHCSWSAWHLQFTGCLTILIVIFIFVVIAAALYIIYSFNVMKEAALFIIDVVGYVVIRQLEKEFELVKHRSEELIITFIVITGTIMTGSLLGGVIHCVMMSVGYWIGEQVSEGDKELHCTINRLVGAILGGIVAIAIVRDLLGMPWGMLCVMLM